VFAADWIMIESNDLLTGENATYIVADADVATGDYGYSVPVMGFGKTEDGVVIPVIILSRSISNSVRFIRVMFDSVGVIEEYRIVDTGSGIAIADYTLFLENMINSSRVAIEIPTYNGRKMQMIWSIGNFHSLIMRM